MYFFFHISDFYHFNVIFSTDSIQNNIIILLKVGIKSKFSVTYIIYVSCIYEVLHFIDIL